MDEALARAVARAGGAEGRPSGRDLRDLAALAARSARAAGGRAVASGRWLSEVVLNAAEHIPVRNLAALREHHGGLAGSLLADPLIRNASLTTAAVGATTGALAAASETTPATWSTLPLELAVETLVVVTVELKLVGELHEAAGIALPAGLREKGVVVARSWAETRGLTATELAGLTGGGLGDPGLLAGATSSLLGRQARDRLSAQIRRRLMRRAGRNLGSLVPFLAGAAAGAELNRRATRRLGLSVARSLGIPPPRS